MDIVAKILKVLLATAISPLFYPFAWWSISDVYREAKDEGGISAKETLKLAILFPVAGIIIALFCIEFVIILITRTKSDV